MKRLITNDLALDRSVFSLPNNMQAKHMLLNIRNYSMTDLELRDFITVKFAIK